MSQEAQSSVTASDPTSSQARAGIRILPAGHLLAGNFEIESIIGRGGMAVVYKAIQKSLNRPVAIKALHDRFARDPEFIERFEAEAGALAALSHPNIVNVIDRGHEGNCYFFIMEYVEGKTLDQLILANTLTLADWRRVVQACCEGLEYVHRRNVVHRDIKPSNILMGTENLIKISDFGIAHILRGETTDTTPKPQALGTAHYMSPEQIEDPGSVDHRADIYSLGVTFFKMFARQLPNEEGDLPSEINRDVPVAVDRVIAKALAENRDERYETVRTFCDDMLKALRDTGTSIVTVLNSRRGNTGAALYTGQDFRAAAPSKAAEDAKDLKSGAKKNRRKSDSKGPKAFAPEEVPVSTSALLGKLTPVPVQGGAPTPPPVAEPSSIPPPPIIEKEPRPPSKSAIAKQQADASTKSHARIAIGAALTALILLGILAFAYFQWKKQQAAIPPPIDPNVTITEQKQQLMDDVIREKVAQEGGTEDGVQPVDSAPPAEGTPGS